MSKELRITLDVEPDEVLVVYRVGDQITVSLTADQTKRAARRLLREAAEMLGRDGMRGRGHA